MNVLIIFENETLPLNIMRCLADAGVTCHLFGAGTSQEIQLSKYCRNYVKCDGNAINTGSPELVEELNRYCLEHKISCIIPGDYQATVFLSKISCRLKARITPIAETATLEMLSNKWTFAQILKTNDLPMPQTFLAENLEQFEAVPLAYPRVVKPLTGGGRWIAGRDHPGSYVKHTREEYLACVKDGFPVLVQEFIPGVDVGLNIFAVKGAIRAWTMQEFVNSDRLKFFQSPELLKLGERLITHTNFQGVCNIDLRIDQRDGAFKFIECNPRFWGSLRASKWNGVNFPLIALNAALGENVDGQIQHKNIEYVFPSKVLLKLFTGDLGALKSLPEATNKDLGQIVSDPLSCLHSILNRR